jgi:hypothetical protein
MLPRGSALGHGLGKFNLELLAFSSRTFFVFLEDYKIY